MTSEGEDARLEVSEPVELEQWSEVLEAPTRACWPIVAAVSPPSGVLMGGTALAIHLRHRRSQDLDIFVHEPFDPGELLLRVEATAEVALVGIADGTLNCVANGVKVQFLEARGQRVIEPPTMLAGMAVGSVRDIAATKYKVIGDRGELRDYYDLMRLAASAGIEPELGLRMYCERYGVGLEHPSVAHIVIALGSFDDVANDPWLSESDPGATLDTVSSYWQQRQPKVAGWLASMLD